MDRTHYFYGCGNCDKVYSAGKRGATWALKHAGTGCGEVYTYYVKNNRIVDTELGIRS